MFYDAIHAVYPDKTIISSLCINTFFPDSQCSSSTSLNDPPAGVATDLHLYQSADATVALFNAFDNVPRTYPILVGEYAAIYSDNDGGNQLDNPTLQSATSEAIMFLGLERNSDIVFGVAHGALMKSLNDEVDNVALLKHNADTIVPSYSYHVAQIFAHNFGTSTAPTTSDSAYGPLYWSSTIGSSGTYYVKVANYNGAASTPVTVELCESTASTATLITLTGPGEYSTNVLGSLTSSVTETTIQGTSGTFSFTLTGSYIVAVLVVT
jgi:alpha-L-arabinofuranosidase